MTNTETTEFSTDLPAGRTVIGRGDRSQVTDWATTWNTTDELVDIGPATVRYIPGTGWTVTVTRWA